MGHKIIQLSDPVGWDSEHIMKDAKFIPYVCMLVS